MPVIFIPLPPIPLILEEQIFKSVSILASVTMIRFAAVSTVYDTLSVSAMKRIGYDCMPGESTGVAEGGAPLVLEFCFMCGGRGLRVCRGQCLWWRRVSCGLRHNRFGVFALARFISKYDEKNVPVRARVVGAC